MDKERSAEKLGGRTTRYWRRRPMKDLTLIRRSNLPAVFAAEAYRRALAGRRAYYRAADEFLAWCAGTDVWSIPASACCNLIDAKRRSSSQRTRCWRRQS